MTRDEVLRRYRPIREAIQRILSAATDSCSNEELGEALSDIAPWVEEGQVTGQMTEMAMDLALFEPDQQGLERFLVGDARALSPDDQALATRMKGAWFSIFRVAEPHGDAGIWLEDLLDDDRRLWLVDEGLEQTAESNDILALRVFDTGEFHAGFGIVLEPGDETLGPCLAARARRVPLSIPSSLAALVYIDHLAGEVEPSEAELDALEELAHLFSSEIGHVVEHQDRPPLATGGSLRKEKSKRRARRQKRK